MGETLSLRLMSALGMVVLLFLGGCGGGLDDEPDRVVVFGQVTYDGKPVEKGEIRFVPAAGTQAPASGASIENGSYRVDHKGGVPIGTFQVRLSAYRAPGGTEGEVLGAPSDDPMAGREQYLPEKYSGANSALTLTIEPGKEPIEKDFALTK